jgi:SAM-dependent methyltransferase
MLNEMINFEKFSSEDGVYILSEINGDFEEAYLKVREKEKRIYSDKEAARLPFASEDNPHKDEWKIREKSFQRFKKYLTTKEPGLNILDLGCGNGWFCGQLSKTFGHNFYCVDVNLTELKQAARIFKSEKLKFIYADIFSTDFQISFFDLSILNSAVQYFPDLKKLIGRLLYLIKANGEIHIIDSPLYSETEVQNAKKRTSDYYSAIGFPEMAEKYFHHTWHELSGYKSDVIYHPGSIKNKIRRLFLIKDSPFPRIKISK